MKTLTLSKGYFAKISNVDFLRCSFHKWSVTDKNGKIYAETKIDGENILLHRFIMKAGRGDPEIDHQDGDGLNCQRYNLRFATRQQNAANSNRKSGVSGYKGVGKMGKKWRAIIRNMNHLEHIGMFETPELAAQAYDKKAREYYGEFARTNF